MKSNSDQDPCRCRFGGRGHRPGRCTDRHGRRRASPPPLSGSRRSSPTATSFKAGRSPVSNRVPTRSLTRRAAPCGRPRRPMRPFRARSSPSSRISTPAPPVATTTACCLGSPLRKASIRRPSPRATRPRARSISTSPATARPRRLQRRGPRSLGLGTGATGGRRFGDPVDAASRAAASNAPRHRPHPPRPRRRPRPRRPVARAHRCRPAARAPRFPKAPRNDTRATQAAQAPDRGTGTDDDRRPARPRSPDLRSGWTTTGRAGPATVRATSDRTMLTDIRSSSVHATVGTLPCTPQTRVPLICCGVALRRHGPR